MIHLVGQGKGRRFYQCVSYFYIVVARHLPETGRIYSGSWFQRDSGPSQQGRHGGVAVSTAAGSEGGKCWRLDIEVN